MQLRECLLVVLCTIVKSVLEISMLLIILYTLIKSIRSLYFLKKVREKSRECHNYKPQPFPDPKRKRKPTNLTNVRKALRLALSSPSEVYCHTKLVAVRN